MNEQRKNLFNNDGADHQLKVYSDITQLVSSPENPTPLVRINHVNRGSRLEIYLKLERYNPFGSVKDRIAREMLSGLDWEGKTIVEPSSGNTGIALVSLANALGIPVKIAVPEKVPEEKKVFLRFLGAEVMEADDALCPAFPTEGARGLVNALVKSPAVAWIVGVAIGTSSTWLPWMQEQGRWGAIAAAVLVTGRRGYSLWKGDNRR